MLDRIGHLARGPDVDPPDAARGGQSNRTGDERHLRAEFRQFGGDAEPLLRESLPMGDTFCATTV